MTATGKMICSWCRPLLWGMVALNGLACGISQREPATPGDDFTIIWGTGGGFTGFADGFILHSDGKMERWSGQYFRREKIRPLGVIDTAHLDSLRRTLARHDLRDLHYQETGNLTTRMWCIIRTDTTIFSWNGVEPGAEVPAAIREVYSSLTRAAAAQQH
ncbi:MAG: hypothetical protein ONB49_10535 [candidate division KSB1 bacterium]|nr:hypothetical protein [candidate division KSB1 bacterium]MDZ7307477.1 hypothetical protein [candidate division KSB1 bacterium]